MNGLTETSVKCVLVGDCAVGKTALLVRFTSETFPDSYRPTVYENTGVDVFMDGIQISLGLWDTAGHDTFRQIRPMSYQQADVILLCYSVANPNSLNNLRHKWIAEVREFLPKVPVLVVATQTDHREMGPYRTTCTTSSEGKQVAPGDPCQGISGMLSSLQSWCATGFWVCRSDGCYSGTKTDKTETWWTLTPVKSPDDFYRGMLFNSHH